MGATSWLEDQLLHEVSARVCVALGVRRWTIDEAIERAHRIREGQGRRGCLRGVRRQSAVPDRGAPDRMAAASQHQYACGKSASSGITMMRSDGEIKANLAVSGTRSGPSCIRLGPPASRTCLRVATSSALSQMRHARTEGEHGKAQEPDRPRSRFARSAPAAPCLRPSTPSPTTFTNVANATAAVSARPAPARARTRRPAYWEVKA